MEGEREEWKGKSVCVCIYTYIYEYYIYESYIHMNTKIITSILFNYSVNIRSTPPICHHPRCLVWGSIRGLKGNDEFFILHYFFTAVHHEDKFMHHLLLIKRKDR